jgi:hypothetical protein
VANEMNNKNKIRLEEEVRIEEGFVDIMKVRTIRNFRVYPFYK